MFRAGLFSVCVLFTSLIGYVACVPVPGRSSMSLVERYDDLSDALYTRSLGEMLGARDFDARESYVYSKRDYLSLLEDRDLDDLSIFDERDWDDLIYEFTKREDTPIASLYRRRSIFTKIKHAFQHVGHAIGHAVVHAAKAVGHFVKTTGAKIAKVALKVYSAATAVAARVVKFIPGIGTGVSTALKGVSAAENKVSDKIHAKLGKFGNRLDHGLNYVINPFGSAAKHMGKGGKALGALF
ncbi:hypothetical protein CPB84DRAFT_1827774 [Gymnopilus junonius]|uniref:Uncharacterized protein n=1 Tax=Gymnopilus junonius TaxID=109634 RepID=A0A9P5NE21_GYMJU|nr:hypothetical protein CPB84DRAFT_1827774 [Gymnopilus junonius]